MQNLKILNKKETKEILNLIDNQWNADIKLDYAFLTNNKGKVYLANKDIFALELSDLRINSLGLYFAEVKGKEIRLSIEGSQLIGPKAKKNVVELDNNETKKWLRGEDIEKECEGNGFLIIKNNNDYLGSGKYKEKKILNFVPKTRRLNTRN